MGLLRPLFGIYYFSLVHVYIAIYNYFLAMVIGNRKEEGRVCISSIHCSIEKAQRPARIEPVTNSEPEKAKSVQRFEPGLLGQNATALPLAPPPRPSPALMLRLYTRP